MSEKDPQASQPNEELIISLPDLTRLPLRELFTFDPQSTDDSPIANAMRRVAEEEREPEQYAAFGNAPTPLP